MPESGQPPHKRLQLPGAPRMRTLLVGLIGAGVVSLYPSRSTVCPAWTIRIVDTAGNPLRGAFVRQVWKNHSVEATSHEQDAYTAGSGLRGVQNITQGSRCVINLTERQR